MYLFTMASMTDFAKLMIWFIYFHHQGDILITAY